MKITILQGAFLPVPPLLGGAVEKMWFVLGQKFVLRGYAVTHISRRWGSLLYNEQILGVIHTRVAGYNMPTNALVLKLLDAIYTLRAIKAIPKDADIIVTNTFWGPIFVPLFRRGKVYVDVARMPKGQMRLYGKAKLRANSTPVAEAICAELPENRRSQISMVPNPLPYEALEPVNLTNKGKYILYCGRVHPEKGLELLQKTVSTLADGWILTIVGPWKTTEGGGGGQYLQSLKMLFDRSKVQFLEPIYNIKKLNQLYQKAAIFVYPSIAEKGETFGLAPLEAMAWGTVPVVSDLACFKDFIRHNTNGIIFNHRAVDAQEHLSNCIQELIADEKLRHQLSKAAQSVRISHSPDSIADLFLADFEKLLS